MAVAHILTASSNYLFRSNPAKLNLTQMEVENINRIIYVKRRELC